MSETFRNNWKIYCMEAICLGLFMISASLFGTLLEYPGSWVRQQIDSSLIRNCLMGLAMGLTATGLIYSPMGKLSGAHMNPALSYTFFTLGKIKRHDLLFYVLFQLAGGVIAVYLMRLIIGVPFTDPHVNYVITAPGKPGVAMAFVTEVGIAFMMMLMVLFMTNHARVSRYTGIVAGFFVMSYVILSGPISGFGMNPARSLASAVPAWQFPSFWIYMTAPFIGMLSASKVYKQLAGIVYCAKYHHDHTVHCIFNCGYCQHAAASSESSSTETT